MSSYNTRREFLKIGAGVGIGCMVATSAAAKEGRQRGKPATTVATAAEDKGAGEKSGRSVYIMTDLEGVAGVLDFENWC
jgi:hypothetical protein